MMFAQNVSMSAFSWVIVELFTFVQICSAVFDPCTKRFKNSVLNSFVTLLHFSAAVFCSAVNSLLHLERISVEQPFKVLITPERVSLVARTAPLQVGLASLPPAAETTRSYGLLKSSFFLFLFIFCVDLSSALLDCRKKFLAWLPYIPPSLAKPVTQSSEFVFCRRLLLELCLLEEPLLFFVLLFLPFLFFLLCLLLLF